LKAGEALHLIGLYFHGGQVTMKFHYLVLLMTVLGGVPEHGSATLPSISFGPETRPAAIDPLIGKWSWVSGGIYGIDPGAVMVILEVETVETDGRLRGKETVFIGGEGFPYDLSDARVRNQDGKRHVEVSRGPINALIWYSLVLDPDGRRLQGSFSKPGWSTDEVVFIRQ
jgi:hypothetical protein